MRTELSWAIAVVCDVVAAGLAVSVAWTLVRQAPRRAATGYIIAATALMAVQLAAGACDAWLQLIGTSSGRTTAWGSVAHGASVLAGALLLFFVADLLRQGSRPDDAEADVARAVMRQAQLAIGAIVVLGGWLLWDLGRYASADALTRGVHRFVDSPFSVSLAILCTMPVALLRALWSQTPRARARWVLWLPDGGQPLTSLALREPVPLPPATLSVGDFRAVATLASLSLLILVVGSLSTSESWTPVTIGLLTICRVGLLVSTIGVAYVVTHYLFLDVVLRQALVSFTLAVVLGGGGHGTSRGGAPLKSDRLEWLG